jgi:hypothetical protein
MSGSEAYGAYPGAGRWVTSNEYPIPLPLFYLLIRMMTKF